VPRSRWFSNMMQAFSKFDPPGVVYVFIGRKIGVALPHLSRKRVLPQRLPICHFGWEIKLLKSFEDYMGLPTRRDIYNLRKR